MEVPGSSVGKKQGVDEMREKIGVTLPLYVLIDSSKHTLPTLLAG
jgi:hypothetical protein